MRRRMHFGHAMGGFINPLAMMPNLSPKRMITYTAPQRINKYLGGKMRKGHYRYVKKRGGKIRRVYVRRHKVKRVAGRLLPGEKQELSKPVMRSIAFARYGKKDPYTTKPIVLSSPYYHYPMIAPPKPLVNPPTIDIYPHQAPITRPPMNTPEIDIYPHQAPITKPPKTYIDRFNIPVIKPITRPPMNTPEIDIYPHQAPITRPLVNTPGWGHSSVLLKPVKYLFNKGIEVLGPPLDYIVEKGDSIIKNNLKDDMVVDAINQMLSGARKDLQPYIEIIDDIHKKLGSGIRRGHYRYVKAKRGG